MSLKRDVHRIPLSWAFATKNVVIPPAIMKGQRGLTI